MSSNDKVPVTVLSGYLGAGKTTLLNNILQNKKGLKVGVIVNDMGEVNIDKELVDQKSDLDPDEEEVIDLSNGCICCQLRGDLLDEAEKIVENRDVDYLVVESSGISEPIPVAQTFTYERADDGERFRESEKFQMDTMVSVVDAYSFWKTYNFGEDLPEEHDHDHDHDYEHENGEHEHEHEENSHEEAHEHYDEDHHLGEVLMEQIEFCDVLVLNKVDKVLEEVLEEMREVLDKLQPRAKRIETTYSNVDVEEVLGTGLFNFQEISKSSGWKREMNGGHGHGGDAAEAHGVNSFVFNSRKPFNPEKFKEFLKNVTEDVIRAKGFFWVATNKENAYEMAITGPTAQITKGGKWVSSLPEHQRKQMLMQRPGLAREIEDNEFGDRKNKLVFIGSGLNQEEIVSKLEECLEEDLVEGEDSMPETGEWEEIKS